MIPHRTFFGEDMTTAVEEPAGFGSQTRYRWFIGTVVVVCEEEIPTEIQMAASAFVVLARLRINCTLISSTRGSFAKWGEMRRLNKRWQQPRHRSMKYWQSESGNHLDGQMCHGCTQRFAVEVRALRLLWSLLTGAFRYVPYPVSFGPVYRLLEVDIFS